MSLRTMWYAFGLVGLVYALYLQHAIAVMLFGGSIVVLAILDAARFT